MNRVTSAIALATLCILSASCSFGGPRPSDETFDNPVIAVDWPDPTIWSDGGNFYSLATTISTIRTSTNLVDWNSMHTYPLDCAAREAVDSLSDRIWAPDMTKIGDRWMLYLTCYKTLHDCRIAAFSSTSPTGPFSFESVVTDSKVTGIKDTIDPEVVVDPKTGKVWLFFGSTGGIFRVQLNKEGTALADGADFVHVAGCNDEADGSRETVFEGTYLHRHKGWWYLFASKGQFWSHTYGVVVGRSRTIEGKFMDREGRPLAEGYASPVISSEKEDRFYGPGHNGEIFMDATGQDYILYHCHDKQASNSGTRVTLLQRICWDRSGWPYVEGGKPAETDVKPTITP